MSSKPIEPGLSRYVNQVISEPQGTMATSLDKNLVIFFVFLID